ncbi:histidinol dehydrogenase [Clostridium saccharoperbutylacetonicum]|uniref:Histidinol dehydrogenase n=1 Tax=Clostridium saccharoperbutylacetonicum N1-4(HMT) TaxID=931276 RepID=M1MBK7_9CLOT|nr:histidinol dehydrogenase [Clostridium saccharoperbutylacetonicum]AGF55304.1 histidinol dehydrogenase HisD [Clostridium saccharoperbutylacetonicum N1-4(HMT)]NRT63983.1 histidinol dehydrogenase [Clostridium saccharoperbutylacetonicum]NSB27350.1 histidinol dehydrogenase [Clostridium saccharoperbutylacetonicum]NSB40839.1 histidinol dehydrogenase [Clostridium saccharoperbutylacetonicum]
MLNLMEITKENKETLIKELKGRVAETEQEIISNVNGILSKVKSEGDKALFDFTEAFDKIVLKNLEVSKDEIEECFNKVEDDFIEALEEAKANIEAYHNKQKSNGFLMTKDKGVYLGQRVLPLERVGVYVPGGTAAYPSSVLMNVIPAKVAGVDEIIMVTPPDKDGGINPYIGVAAKIAGIDKIYKVGGAQGVAALAYGTETIQKVDKIVGPGNIFVATAKKLVFGEVDIDMIAGPSEILVIADEKSDPSFVAADLMSQAEHDRLASSILITTSKDLYEKVEVELEKQINTLEREEIIRASLKDFGTAIICANIEECIDISNAIAPEHLEIMVDDPMQYLGMVRNAGSVFLGRYCPEPIGDYFGGTNHVLPTSGTARFFSPLSVDSFIKKSSFIYYSKEAIEENGEKIITLANKEGLTAHANSVKVRLNHGRV